MLLTKVEQVKKYAPENPVTGQTGIFNMGRKYKLQSDSPTRIFKKNRLITECFQLKTAKEDFAVFLFISLFPLTPNSNEKNPTLINYCMCHFSNRILTMCTRVF